MKISLTKLFVHPTKKEDEYRQDQMVKQQHSFLFIFCIKRIRVTTTSVTTTTAKRIKLGHSTTIILRCDFNNVIPVCMYLYMHA